MNKKNSQGSVWLEGALVVPLILLIVLFLVEVSILLLRYTAIQEGISKAAREISLPKKNSQIENDPAVKCNEIVSIRIEEQMRAFRQTMNKDDFEIIVKDAALQELAIITNVKMTCSVCNALLGAMYTPFVLRLEEPVILQDKIPQCEVDG